VSDSENRREHERVSSSAVERVLFDGAEEFEACYLRDISQGGMFLETKSPRALDDLLFVAFALPGGPEFWLRARVVRIITPEEASAEVRCGMGVEFLDLSPKVKSHIEAYIARLKSGSAGKPRP
jgi:Tfp pilus assembly protein PilZ